MIDRVEMSVIAKDDQIPIKILSINIAECGENQALLICRHYKIPIAHVLCLENTLEKIL